MATKTWRFISGSRYVFTFLGIKKLPKCPVIVMHVTVLCFVAFMNKKPDMYIKQLDTFDARFRLIIYLADIYCFITVPSLCF